MNSLKNSNKELIKVFVVLGSEKNLFNTTKKKDSQGRYYYTGFVWEIWKKIHFELKDQYNFKLFFSELDDQNYDKFVKYVKNGKFDIVLGLFNYNGIREKMVDFTKPLLISSNSILYLKKESLVTDIKAVINESSIKLLLYLVIFGTIFGLSLYYFDPGRINLIQGTSLNKKNFLLRSIVTGISSMIGQTGFLTEHTSLSISGIILVIFILIIGFIFVLFFQGIITKTLLKKHGFIINKYNIQKYKFIGFKGDDSVRKIKRYSAKIKLFSKKSHNEMVKLYIDNQDKYDGFVISYINGIRFIKENSNLTMSSDFNLEPQSFIINQTKIKFGTDINIVIANLKYTLELQKICQSYFGNPQDIPVCKL